MSRGALLRYAAAWLLASVAVVFLALSVLGDREDDDDVTLPPVKYTELAAAARDARCELRRGSGGRAGDPPVSGPAGPPARPGVYTRPPGMASLVAALRRGVIVIHYRPGLAGERVDEIEELQKAVPSGTIVTPNPAMRYVLAVTGWRQLLGCGDVGEVTIDAIRLFRGRFVGSGPDTDPGPPD